MSNLDTDYNLLLQEVEEKVRQAEVLLAEASKLASQHNIKIDKGDVDNLYNLVEELSTVNWDDSESSYDDDNDYWRASANTC